MRYSQYLMLVETQIIKILKKLLILAFILWTLFQILYMHQNHFICFGEAVLLFAEYMSRLQISSCF